jgi:hypothetical protein
MEQTQKEVLSKFLRFVPILSVGIALIALLTSLEARKKGLTCTYVGSTNLVSVASAGLEKSLKVEVSGQTVTSLAKMSFTVRNTGAVAIRSDDIKEPIGLYFPKNAKLLSAAVDRTNPPGFTFRVNLDAANNIVYCDFPLLNSGDEAYVSTYVYDSPAIIPQLKGRVVDLKSISNVDESGKQAANPFPYLASVAARKAAYWTLLISHALLVIVAITLLCVAGTEYFRWRLWLRRWANVYEATVLEAAPKRRSEYDHARQAGRTKFPELFNVLNPNQLFEKGIPKNPNTSLTSSDYLLAESIFGILALVFAFTWSFIYFAPSGF